MLAGVEATVLNGGAVLCHPEWPVPLVSRVMARLLILDVSRPILRGQQVAQKACSSCAQLSFMENIRAWSYPCILHCMYYHSVTLHCMCVA